MAENNKKLINSDNSLIGSQTQATILDNASKIDIDTNKILIDNIIEAGLNNKLDSGALEKFTTISNSRDQIYTLIDTMSQDSTVSAILRTYTEDVCETADNGHIVWCESKDADIAKFVNYILNVMNVDKNIFGWVYNLLKYGDVYLRLYRESDYDDDLFNAKNIAKAYSARNVLNEDLNKIFNEAITKKLEESIQLNIHNTADHYSFYVEMVPDPSTMFELTRFGKTYGYIETPNQTINEDMSSNPLLSGDTQTGNTFNYKLKSNDVNVYQADDFVHAYLEDSYSRFPEQVELFTDEKAMEEGKNSHIYNVRRGKSLLFDSYKIWREKSLLESSAILNRITRSSILRKVSVEVGDMPKEQVQATLRRVKEMMEQKTALNTGKSMAEYTNPGPMENSIYFATHNGQGAITVESVGGDVEVKNLGDLDWWNNKFYSSYGIPKQYFGWTDDGAGFNGGSSLTILSSVYAKGVKRVQNAIIQAITDAVNLILLDKGLNSYVNNFTLKMRTPVTQEELSYRENLTNRISAISNMQSIFSDVEDRGRKLAILKSLFETLSYNTDIMDIIQDEIDAYEVQLAKEEEEAAANNTGTDTDISGGQDLETVEEPADSGSDDLDLTPMPEDLNNDILLDKTILIEDLEDLEDLEDEDILAEASNVLVEENDLPSPEDLGDIDFTENN